MHHHVQFYAVLGIKPRPLNRLGKCYTNWATFPRTLTIFKDMIWWGITFMLLYTGHLKSFSTVLYLPKFPMLSMTLFGNRWPSHWNGDPNPTIAILIKRGNTDIMWPLELWSHVHIPPSTFRGGVTLSLWDKHTFLLVKPPSMSLNNLPGASNEAENICFLNI